MSQSGDHWCTPENVLAPVREMFRGTIGLDPCSNETSIVGATIEWDVRYDGLRRQWRHGDPGTVFVNPPHSDKRNWLDKCQSEARAWHRAEIIALVPADTDTKHFHEIAADADSLCFWRGRLTYIGDRSYPARFPSLLVYWGRDVRRFRRIFSAHGWCP